MCGCRRGECACAGGGECACEGGVSECVVGGECARGNPSLNTRGLRVETGTACVEAEVLRGSYVQGGATCLEKEAAIVEKNLFVSIRVDTKSRFLYQAGYLQNIFSLLHQTLYTHVGCA